MQLLHSLIGIGLLSTIFCQSQNLIPNAGFEYSYTCPNKPNQITRAVGWYNPTKGSPDYYNACNKDDFSVPKNRYGEKKAYQGKAYAALHGRKYYREYIQTRLEKPLIKGKRYSCSIHISANESSNNVPSDIGMLFTKEKITRKHNSRIKNYQPQIENHIDSIFADYEWHEIKGSFIAKGGEQYLTIGSFRKTVSIINISGNYANREASWYYFIDNATTKPVIRKKSKKQIQSLFNKIRNINFENGSDKLRINNLDGLNTILRILKRNLEISVKVIGHTDNNGTIASNKTLSIRRCNVVKQFFTKHGISSSRIMIEGKGDSSPLVPNTTNENKIKNRRVEFKLI